MVGLVLPCQPDSCLDGVLEIVVMVVFGISFVACPLYGLDKELAIPADSLSWQQGLMLALGLFSESRCVLCNFH